LACCDDPQFLLKAIVRQIARGQEPEVCMSEGGIALDKDASPERKRYRGLLEITDLVVRAKSLPDAFKELAPRCSP
jgi:hypothetical protein